MKVLNFNEFLYEDGEGGGGVASATMGNTGGMGNITSPTVSATPGDVAGSKPGSGDIAAHAVRPATKIPATNRKKPKKRKFQLEPKIVRMAGTNASKESMYVTSFKDWTGSGVNENKINENSVNGVGKEEIKLVYSDIIEPLLDKKIYTLEDMIDCYKYGSNETYTDRFRIIELLVYEHLIYDENGNHISKDIIIDYIKNKR